VLDGRVGGVVDEGVVELPAKSAAENAADAPEVGACGFGGVAGGAAGEDAMDEKSAAEKDINLLRSLLDVDDVAVSLCYRLHSRQIAACRTVKLSCNSFVLRILSIQRLRLQI
jgi:hypothetical protein